MARESLNNAAIRKISQAFLPPPGPAKIKSSSEHRKYAQFHSKRRVVLGMDHSSPGSDLLDIHQTRVSRTWA